MHVAILDIVQYDCPVVKLTDITKDVKVVVIGANVAEIHKGYERIYITIKGQNRDDIIKALNNVQKLKDVKSFTILYRKSNEARVYMYIKKTKAMEASVLLDAMPVVPWISINGVERWTLGFPSKKQLYEYVSLVKEQDSIENIIVREVPDDVIMTLTLLYPALIDFIVDTKELTENQLNILKIALNEGYYEWPRRINVIELSAKLGISRAAVTKVLRRAESKVLRSVLKLIKAHKELSMHRTFEKP